MSLESTLKNNAFLLFFSNWWPLFVLVFYILAPIPTVIARRYAQEVESSSALVEMCIFLTCGVVISAYGLPIILARSPVAAPVVSKSLFFDMGIPIIIGIPMSKI